MEDSTLTLVLFRFSPVPCVMCPVPFPSFALFFFPSFSSPLTFPFVFLFTLSVFFAFCLVFFRCYFFAKHQLTPKTQTFFASPLHQNK